MWSKEIGELWSEGENDYMEDYFKRSFRYEFILVQLSIHHKIKMCLHTLKRHFKVLGLNESHATALEAVIKQIIEREIEGLSMLRGYRSMRNKKKKKKTRKLRTTYNIIVPRDSVMEILREVHPLCSIERRSRNLERHYCHSLE